MLQKPVDEYNALILHERQLVQTAREKLASLMREVQEKRERAAADRPDEEMSSSSPPVVRSEEGQVQKKKSCGRCTSWQPPARNGM